MHKTLLNSPPPRCMYFWRWYFNMFVFLVRTHSVSFVHHVDIFYSCLSYPSHKAGAKSIPSKKATPCFSLPIHNISFTRRTEINRRRKPLSTGYRNTHLLLAAHTSPLRRTARWPTHIQQDIQHIHASHIRPHSCLINLRTPLIQQRIQRQRKPILVLARAPTRTAIRPLTPVMVRVVIGVEVGVVSWRWHDGYGVRIWVVRLGGYAPEGGGEGCCAA
jgi:hypothetical protein